ncbi:aldo/keto reductase [Parvularcula sp. IMCC14364]|uniref:aldo/keto reductase n=1 Tax=Parvularcula sp. IMCC14364 TaxID=3067902 RepID=UPI0027425BF7|nr:aldo/keto reductase [Parvularcula sp. IMCC14364]
MTKIPEIGYGLWKVDRAVCAQTVYDAIEVGYRHFDSACDYGNEAEAGQGFATAIADGLVTRDDLWITSKLWNTYHKAEHVRPACERSLSDLGVEQLDLYLVHFPIALEYVPFDTRYPPEWLHDPTAAKTEMKLAPVSLVETWAAMEELVDAGLVKQIGVCNYNSALLHDLMAYARIKPAALQIESHPYLTQEKLIRLAQNYGMDVTAFSPLGASSYLELGMAADQDMVLANKVIQDIADRHGKSAAQVVLRWGIQRGTSIIPKATQVAHMRENLAAQELELSVQEMEQISALNKNRRFNDPGVFCEQAFGRFHPIYD